MSADTLQTSTLSMPENGRRTLPRWLTTALIVGGVLIVLLVIGAVIWLALNFPAQIEAIRDVFIMVFALVACASLLVMVLLLTAVIRLINMLEFEIKPILEKTNQTIRTVQVTTAFVSSNVVQPAITVNSYFAGLRRGFRVLFGNPRKNLPD